MKLTNLHLSAIAALVTAGISGSATAATIINSIDGFGSASAGATGDNGFTFTTGVLGTENLLSTIEVTAPDGAGTQSLTLQFFLDADQDSNTWNPTVTVLATSDAQIFSDTTSATTTWTFTDLPTLADNTVYGVRYGNAAGTAASTSHRYVGVGTNTAASITETGGHIFDNSAPVFTRGAPIKVTTVPEPSSTALLGLGGLALIARRRRS